MPSTLRTSIPKCQDFCRGRNIQRAQGKNQPHYVHDYSLARLEDDVDSKEWSGDRYRGIYSAPIKIKLQMAVSNAY